jgi:hypothetical protein
VNKEDTFMDNPAILIPYLIMVANVVTFAGIFTYALHCALGRGCKVSVIGLLSAK